MTLPTFYFKYSKQKTRDPKTGEKGIIFVPKVPCRLWHGTKSRGDNAILDSGADSCVINMATAKYLGLEMKEARPMRVVGNSEVKAYKANVDFVIDGGKHSDPITVEVMIPAEGDTPILIGRKPFFELYKITFIEAELKFNMIPYKKG